MTSAWDRAEPPAWGIDDAGASRRASRRLAPIDASLDAGTPAALVYTSGTTGPAKGAVITHGNLCANARMLVDAWRFTADDRLLLALPLFHVHGLGNGVHCWLLSGCRTRLLERFDHASAAATLLDFRPDGLLRRADDVRAAAGGGGGGGARASAPASVVRVGLGAAAGAGAGGLRGALRSAHPRALRHDRDADDARQPLRRRAARGHGRPSLSRRLDPHRRRTGTRPCPTANSGELLVQSPTVFAGYWNRPDATAAAFTDGWFQDRRHRRAVAATATSRCAGAAATWSSPAASTSTRAKSKSCWRNIRRSPRWRWPGVPDRASAARCRLRLSCARRCRRRRRRAHRPLPGVSWRRSRCPERVVFLERLPRTALGKVQKRAPEDPSTLTSSRLRAALIVIGQTRSGDTIAPCRRTRSSRPRPPSCQTGEALGMIETRGLAAAHRSRRRDGQDGQRHVVAWDKVDAGLVTVLVRGDVGLGEGGHRRRRGRRPARRRACRGARDPAPCRASSTCSST